MKEKLEDRLSELAKQRQSAHIELNKTIANITAIEGAMQEVQYWIDSLKKEGVIE